MGQTCQGLGTLRRPAGLLDEPLEQASSPLDVTRGDVVLRSGATVGRVAAARSAVGVRSAARSADRAAASGAPRWTAARAASSRAAATSASGRVDARARCVGPLLGFGDDVGQSSMGVAAMHIRRPRVRRGRQQRMREAHLVAIRHEDAFALRTRPGRAGPRRHRSRSRGAARSAAMPRLRRARPSSASGPRRSSRVPDEGVETRPFRERLQVGRRLASGDRAPELEGVERVTARDGAQADERRPRQIEPDARPKQPVDLVERQFPEIEPGDPFRGDPVERGDLRLSVGGALSGDDADRLRRRGGGARSRGRGPTAHRARARHRWRSRRGWIAAASRSTCPTPSDTARGGGAVAAGTRRSAASSAMRCGSGRSSSCGLVTSPSRSLSAAKARPVSTSVGRATSDPMSALPGRVDGVCPERGLADAGRPGEQEHAESTLDGVEEPRGLREFAFAADDGRVHGPMQCMACDGWVDRRAWRRGVACRRGRGVRRTH